MTKKKFWQAVNNLAQRKNDAAPIVVTTNQGILNDDEAANMLNHQFIRSGEYSSTVRYEHPSVDAYKKKPVQVILLYWHQLRSTNCQTSCVT